MEIPTSNFFQVTINTNKLYSFILDIKKQIQIQESKTDQLFKSIGKMMNFSSQLCKFQTSTNIELQKIRRSVQQQNNYIRLHMKDADKKAGQRIQNLEKISAVLSNKINQVKQELQEDICVKLSYLQKKIDNKMGTEEVEDKIKDQILKINDAIEKIQKTQSQINHNIDSDIKKNVHFSSTLIQNHQQQQFILKDQILKYTPDSIQNKFRSKKKLKTQKIYTLNNQQLDKTFQKIQEFRQKSSNQSSNTPECKKIKDLKLNKKQSNLNRTTKALQYQAKQKQFEKAILAKMDIIQQKATQKVVQMQKQLLKLSNKYQIVDEYIAILLRKLQKQKTRLQDVNLAIKRFQQRKIDQKTIESLKSNIKKIGKDCQNQLQLKLNKQLYEQQFNKLDQKITILGQAINQKSQKSDVKKWFSFFQEKIKEIIIVLAEDRNITNDGAIKRLPFKCLSCDKQLHAQTQEQLGSSKSWMNMNPSRENSRNNSMRNSTTQLRKKMRISNHCSGSQN